jgi:hypothetical protein
MLPPTSLPWFHSLTPWSECMKHSRREALPPSSTLSACSHSCTMWDFLKGFSCQVRAILQMVVYSRHTLEVICSHCILIQVHKAYSQFKLNNSKANFIIQNQATFILKVLNLLNKGKHWLFILNKELILKFNLSVIYLKSQLLWF